jgi:hypothetical protein
MNADVMWDYKTWLRTAPTVQQVTKYQHFKIEQRQPLMSMTFKRRFRAILVLK